MPDKVPTDVILKSLARRLARVTTDEAWLSFEDFKDQLIQDDVYTSDPSIRNAWLRVRGSQYCRGTIPGKTPRTKKMLLELSWIRQDLGLEIIEEQKKKNTCTAGEAY